MQKYYKVFLIFLIIVMINGCGFKLRSQKSLPLSLHNIYYQTENPYGSLDIALKTALKGSGINLVADESSAKVILNIISTNFTYNQTSIGPSTQARVYHLILSMTFNLTTPKGKIILPPQTISSARDLTLAPNEVFETSGQVDAAKQTMQQEIIMRTFYILSSKKVFDALK